MQITWYLYALIAAMFWGVYYAVSGKVLEKISPMFLLLVGLIPLIVMILLSIKSLMKEYQIFNAQDLNFKLLTLLAVSAGYIGTYFLYTAISNKNATLAGLVEMTYPLFVALVAYVLFKEVHFNWYSAGGAVLIISGVAIVALKG